MGTNGVARLARLAGVLSLFTVLAAAAAPPPPEAFGRLPEFLTLALSPNGRSLAWGEDGGKTTTVVMLDLESGRTLAKLPLTDKLRTLRWADDATLLIEITATASPAGTRESFEFQRIFSLDVPTGRICMLLMRDDTRQYVTGSQVLATHTGKPKTVIMSSWDFSASSQRMQTGTRLAGKRADSGWLYSIFEVDTRSCEGTLLDRGTQFTDHWVVSADGRALARVEWDAAQRRQTLVAKQGSGWNVVLARDDVALHIATRSLDGRSVLAIGNLDGRSKLWTVPLDGSSPSIVAEHPQLEIAGFIRDEFTGAPIGVSLSGDEDRAMWIDPRARSRGQSLANAFADRNTYIVSHSQSFEQVIARVGTASTPSIYYAVDFKSGRADIVGNAYPALAEIKLGQVRSTSYTARDGATIPAYLTVPGGTDEKNLPLVVFPHGGPESRDYLRFDWWTQFLASRGYAVLQPQFRGSTGYGEAHRTAGYRQWGGLMQDDVTDGVKAMIEQGIADPERVCIIGASYGGYSALAGAAFTPDLYACAVSVNGVSDLPAMLSYVEQRSGDQSDALHYWRDHIGPKLDPRVIEKSPARAAAAIRIPILLLHGQDDTVVPLSQSERMYKALERKRPAPKLVKLPGEDHWLSKAETRIRMLAELESFLAQHLGPSRPAASGSAAP